MFSDLLTITSRKETEDRNVQIMCLPYVKGVSEKIEKTCKAINATTKVKAVFKPYRMMRQILMRVKNPVPAEKKELFMKFRVRNAPRFMYM